MRTLLLMRHGKSDWEADYGADHERPLNERGVRSARLMGRVVASQDRVPHLIISSTAVRARTTAELAIESGGWDTELRLDAALYESGPSGVLEVAAAAPDVDRLMLVGHQPTWSMLVRQTTGEQVDMKTASIAVIDIELRTWAGIDGADGSLVALLQPGEFDGSP